MMHHFADDTNITFSYKSLKKVNQCINHDLSLLVQWLRANRISLNTRKTELFHFRQKITKNLNFRISGQKIDTIKQTNYFGIYLDDGLTINQTNYLGIYLDDGLTWSYMVLPLPLHKK